MRLEMKQLDDEWSSTRVCPCGESITWSEIDPRLDDWMKVHGPHCNGDLRCIETESGARVTGGMPEHVVRLKKTRSSPSTNCF
jgi:hypothetical protein